MSESRALPVPARDPPGGGGRATGGRATSDGQGGAEGRKTRASTSRIPLVEVDTEGDGVTQRGSGGRQPDLVRLLEIEAYAIDLRERNRKHTKKGMSKGHIRKRPWSCLGSE